MENRYRDFYCGCIGTYEAYKSTVADYKKEADELRQGLKDFQNSPLLIKVYRKNLRTVNSRLANYKHRMVCLEDLLNRYGVKDGVL
jgi:hypothetical protein